MQDLGQGLAFDETLLERRVSFDSCRDPEGYSGQERPSGRLTAGGCTASRMGRHNLAALDRPKPHALGTHISSNPVQIKTVEMNAKPKPPNHPRPPSHLAPATRRWFRAVVEEFELESHHVRLLTLACEAWDRGQQARRVVEKEGLVFSDFRGQPKARPEIAIERDARTSFARLVREMGLDVADPDENRPNRVKGGR